MTDRGSARIRIVDMVEACFRRGYKRCGAAALVVALGILCSPASARADLSLVFNRASASAGERIEAFSGTSTGQGVRYAPFSGIAVYLVPIALALRQTRLRSTGLPRDRRIIPLGALRRDHAGVARISFRLPRVRPGDYTTAFLCRPCAPPLGAFFTSARPGERWSGRPFGRILRVRGVS
jgi:hypothetical protein